MLFRGKVLFYPKVFLFCLMSKLSPVSKSTLQWKILPLAVMSLASKHKTMANIHHNFMEEFLVSSRCPL